MDSKKQATHKNKRGALYRLTDEQVSWWDPSTESWRGISTDSVVIKGALSELVPIVEVDKGEKYKKRITVCNGVPVNVDIYDVLRTWEVTDPAHAHGLKKILQPGSRGAKTVVQDLEEGINSLQMYLQYVKQGVAE